MSKNCAICDETVNKKKPGIQCAASCDRFFHGQCAGLANKQLDALRMDGISWRCSDCRGVDANTRGSLVSAVGGPSPPTTRSFAAARENAGRGDLIAALDGIHSELKAIKDQQSLFSSSVNFCSDKISDFEDKLNRINEWMRATDRILRQNADIKASVSSLDSRLSELEQSARSRNIEIQGIPEKSNENLIEVVKKIAEYIDIDVNQNEIEHVHRIKPKQSDKTKIKSIIVEFRSRKIKEDFLAKSKQRRMRGDKGSSKMNIPGLSECFFVNEHLTLANKILYKEARSVAKTKLFKYVWVKNGMIFLRQDDSSRIIHVKSLNTLGDL